MTSLDTGFKRAYQQRNGSRFRLHKDCLAGFSSLLSIFVMLAGTGLFITGCQAGPGVPLGFGPPLDNLFGVLILVLVGFGLYRLLAPRLMGNFRIKSAGAAESIARERYARGEITETEFRQILRTLDVPTR